MPSMEPTEDDGTQHEPDVAIEGDPQAIDADCESKQHVMLFGADQSAEQIVAALTAEFDRKRTS